jgi:prevent-host-death family protein
MAEVTIRELRNHGGEVVDRVAGGEAITVTRDGRPVAELRPITPSALSADVILRHWRRLPSLDPTRLRRDIDELLRADL